MCAHAFACMLGGQRAKQHLAASVRVYTSRYLSTTFCLLRSMCCLQQVLQMIMAILYSRCNCTCNLFVSN